ncbi:MAG: GDP-mannose 4,6-dehydratase [Candidatus Sumerlaeia bacterium]
MENTHCVELPKNQRVMITGLTGQDGYYLARMLLARGCEVVALVHHAEMDKAHEIRDELGPIELVPCDLRDQAAVECAIKARSPHVIYHLAAQSSVFISWKEPLMTAQANAMGTIYILDAIRRHCPGSSMVTAGSCDCFDHDAATNGLLPTTPFRATNPYATSKVMAHQYVHYYRDAFNLRASVAIFFNHTSTRRPEHFVERGIVANAVRVALGQQDAIELGSLETRRDWSWAPELVDAFARMGAMPAPADLVLASGRTMTTGDWVREAFSQLGLDMSHVRVDPTRCHPGDRQHTFGNIEDAKRLLGWEPKMTLSAMVKALIDHDMSRMNKS